jgi:uncharacterized protein YjiS (DUF1127 family)
MAAMRMLHCTISFESLDSFHREEEWGFSMGFFTELFSRPRPREDARYRAALAVLDAMSPADRADIGVKPADFPRIAREMATR